MVQIPFSTSSDDGRQQSKNPSIWASCHTGVPLSTWSGSKSFLGWSIIHGLGHFVTEMGTWTNAVSTTALGLSLTCEYTFCCSSMCLIDLLLVNNLTNIADIDN